MKTIASFHLGASSLSSALITTDCQISAATFKAIPPPGWRMHTYDQILDDLTSSFRDLTKNAACDAIVVTTPAPIDKSVGTVRIAPGIPGIQHRQLVGDLVERFREPVGKVIPVYIENDANAAGLRSREFGLGRDVDDFIHVRVSTGIGAALFLNGSLYVGPRHLAGEIGHVPLQAWGKQCGCGNQGCAETLIGGAALLEILKVQSPSDAPTGCHFLDITQGRTAPSDAVRAELATMGTYLGIVLAGAVNLIGPEVVLLSGPMFDPNGILLREAQQEAKKRFCIGMECDLVLDEFAGADGHALSSLAVFLHETGNGHVN